MTAANRSSQEGTVDEVLDLTDRTASVALFGSIGIGKTFVSRTVLDHDRTKAKFGQHRYSMSCDPANSLEGFLTRLAGAINTDVKQLRRCLRSPPSLILLLDDADHILNPLTPGFQEISETIEEFGCYEHVCLITVSRSCPDIHGFHLVEIPTPSKDCARNMFYNLCSLERSPAVDNLIVGLGFHPLSIELLASFVRENNWDEPTLVEAWDSDRLHMARTSYHLRLKGVVEPILRSPTMKGLGAASLDVLREIAASRSGVEGHELERRVSRAGQVVDVLRKLSLVHCQDGVVKMYFPIRCYFLEPTSGPGKRDEAHFLYACYMPGACMSSFRLLRSHNVTHFQGLSVDDDETHLVATRRAWYQTLLQFMDRGEHHIPDFLNVVYHD
jgi:hypothetical protein